MMNIATLVWSSEDINIFTNIGQIRLSQKINPDERYYLRLQSDLSGRLFLRLTQNRKPFMISFNSGKSFEWIPSIPGIGNPISSFDSKLHQSAALISVLDNDHLWIYDLSKKKWFSRELPSDIEVKDISINENGELWCAGNVLSRRIPGEETEAALRYQSAVGNPFLSRSPQLGPIAAARVIRHGGLNELRTIDAEAKPVIGTSNCSWLLDDHSSFIFIFTSKKTFVKRFKGELICHTDRVPPELIRVFTYAGNLWTFNGKRWNRFSLINGINKALSIKNRKILVRGLDSQKEKIVVAVEITPEGAGDFVQNPEFTAVCISEDGGNSFQTRYQFLFNEDKEIQDVAFL